MLRLNGYSTAAFGKYHETAPWEVSVSGPFDRWPTHSGFDKFYSFIGGETNMWAPLIYDGTTKVEPPDDPDYHFTTDMANQAIEWMRFQQSLTPDERKLYARQMEVFAAFAEHTDHEVGRLYDAIEQMGEADNTLFVYIFGDNGSSAEGGLTGTFNEMIVLNGLPDPVEDQLKHVEDMGGPMAYGHFHAGWAHATDTPFQWTKQVASHYGGTRNPLIVHWPKGIKAKGEVRAQWHHVTDIAPTVMEAAGLPFPTSVNGGKQKPFEGVSLIYSFDDPEAEDLHTTQYFEMFGNRAIYHDGWVAAAAKGR